MARNPRREARGRNDSATKKTKPKPVPKSKREFWRQWLAENGRYDSNRATYACLRCGTKIRYKDADCMAAHGKGRFNPKKLRGLICKDRVACRRAQKKRGKVLTQTEINQLLGYEE